MSDDSMSDDVMSDDVMSDDVMSDEAILQRVKSLVDEEHAMRESGEALDPQRVERLEVMLDQCWDLLRQRRAHREFKDADVPDASVRDADLVEHYQQ
jgi:hypothetical protein